MKGISRAVSHLNIYTILARQGGGNMAVISYIDFFIQVMLLAVIIKVTIYTKRK
jgi:hypothetical protein